LLPVASPTGNGMRGSPPIGRGAALRALRPDRSPLTVKTAPVQSGLRPGIGPSTTIEGPAVVPKDERHYARIRVVTAFRGMHAFAIGS
jgi:hypothetical protein